jgi:hypothetical protein
VNKCLENNNKKKTKKQEKAKEKGIWYVQCQEKRTRAFHVPFMIEKL